MNILLIILAFIIIGLVCFLLGMIIESAFENNTKIEQEQEQETIEVIEINDHRKESQIDQKKDYFKPF